VFALNSLLLPVVTVVSLAVCLMCFHRSLSGPYFLVAVLSFLASAELLDGLRSHGGGRRFASWSALFDISVRWACVIVFVWVVVHLSHVSGKLQHRILAVWASVTPFGLWLAEDVTQRLMIRGANGANGASRLRRAIIVGLTQPGLQLERQLGEEPSLRVQVLGFFEDRSVARLAEEGRDRILGKCTDVPDFVRRHQVSVAYVTLPMNDHPRIVELLDKLRDTTVSVYFVPNLSVYELVHARFDVIGVTPVFAVRESPFFGASSILKRLTDILVASVAVLLLAPVFLLVALGVGLSSSGPVLFKQRRYGLDGREIWVFKFRSMTVTEDGAATYTQVTREDTRVTPFGSLIRRTSLDELPQLFNVISGTLSIVGPRPHAIAVNEQYRKLIPGYMLRHKIKPGITGWAQINGCRGGDDLESMRRRIECDMEYLRHWSLSLDLSIILKTALLVWRDTRAY
jgi:putative colanic acid biosysnthesis UDP-glucose lipid carrier transferase